MRHRRPARLRTHLHSQQRQQLSNGLGSRRNSMQHNSLKAPLVRCQQLHLYTFVLMTPLPHRRNRPRGRGLPRLWVPTSPPCAHKLWISYQGRRRGLQHQCRPGAHPRDRRHGRGPARADGDVRAAGARERQQGLDCAEGDRVPRRNHEGRHIARNGGAPAGAPVDWCGVVGGFGYMQEWG